jgi:peptidylprolyl isomerase domain and WD repeat-containing protein 1
MSDTGATDETILGKRGRDGVDALNVDTPDAPVGDESDDDDVGPMPMPDNGTSTGGAKKKRKGVLFCWLP